MFFIVGVSLAILFGTIDASNIRQCTCDEAESCKKAVFDNFGNCYSKCQNDTLISDSSSYIKLDECLGVYKTQFAAAIQCTSEEYNYTCTPANSSDVFIPEVDRTLDLTITWESLKLCKKLGITSLCFSNMILASNLSSCMSKCVEEKATACNELDCGLKLPTVKKVVKMSMRCIVNNGIGTAEAQKICHCVANNNIGSISPSSCDHVTLNWVQQTTTKPTLV